MMGAPQANFPGAGLAMDLGLRIRHFRGDWILLVAGTALSLAILGHQTRLWQLPACRLPVSSDRQIDQTASALTRLTLSFLAVSYLGGLSLAGIVFYRATIPAALRFLVRA